MKAAIIVLGAGAVIYLCGAAKYADSHAYWVDPSGHGLPAGVPIAIGLVLIVLGLPLLRRA